MIRESVVVQVVMTLDLLDLMMIDVAYIRLDVVVQLLRTRGQVVQLDGGFDVHEQVVRRLCVCGEQYRTGGSGVKRRIGKEKWFFC